MSKNDGGPAYPVAFTTTPLQGMSLRDYFAALAMQAMVSSVTYEEGGWAQDNIAQQAYDMADAMLKEREQ